MKPTPQGWPRVASALFYEDASQAIDWLCKAFGFRVRLRVDGPDGSIVHSELELADGLIMVGSAEIKRKRSRSPRALEGANTQSLMAYVDDVEAHCVHARAAGAKILMEPTTTDYGEEYWSDRGYECVDLEGHHWWFMQRLRTGKA
jgi:uncharacterized glyoxalase superfamily protein PhnB